jgi:hypothetical protein
MPSSPRPKPLPLAKEAPAAQVDAADAAREGGAALPSGASVGAPPAKGLWFALVDGDGKTVEIDGHPVRVP